MEEASDECCQAMTPIEGCLGGLPEGESRTKLLAARDRMQRELSTWSKTVSPAPTPETTSLHQLSEEAMDVQRELTLERRRQRYRPEDFDTEQLNWLDQSLARSVAERPDHWRIVLSASSAVYFHYQPLRTLRRSGFAGKSAGDIAKV